MEQPIIHGFSKSAPCVGKHIYLFYLCDVSAIQTIVLLCRQAQIFILLLVQAPLYFIVLPNIILGIRIKKNVPCNKNDCYSPYKYVDTEGSMVSKSQPCSYKAQRKLPINERGYKGIREMSYTKE